MLVLIPCVHALGHLLEFDAVQAVESDKVGLGFNAVYFLRRENKPDKHPDGHRPDAVRVANNRKRSHCQDRKRPRLGTVQDEET